MGALNLSEEGKFLGVNADSHFTFLKSAVVFFFHQIVLTSIQRILRCCLKMGATSEKHNH